MKLFNYLRRLFNRLIERIEYMTIADQISDIQTKVDALATPVASIVDLAPVLDAITALKAEVDTINAKLTPTS